MTDKVQETQAKPTQSAQELVCQGTKAFWLRDYKEAVNLLGQVSEMLAKEHADDKYDGLGNVYLYYGKSLLELARESGDPLGEDVPKEVYVAVADGSGDEDDDDASGEEDGEHEEEEEEEEEVEEKAGEGEKKPDEVKEVAKKQAAATKDDAEVKDVTTTDSQGSTTDSTDVSMKTRLSQDSTITDTTESADTSLKTKDSQDSDLTGTTESADISMNGESASTSQPTSQSTASTASAKAKEGGENASSDESGDEEEEPEEDTEVLGDKEEEDEPSDLQLAWEVLELAKEIFQRRGDSGKEDYAECLIALGEVSMESENFDSAIADIKQGLQIQKEIYTEGKDMRKLAHSNYMLGMAFCANNNVDESMACYKTTLAIIKELLVLLEAIKAPGASDEKEIAEVKSLIPEVEEKITDLQNYADECAKRNDAPEEKDKPTPPSSPEKKASNISHLVKRKREESADADSGNACKKPAPAPTPAPSPAP